MYRSVNELPEECLDILKQAMYYGDDDHAPIDEYMFPWEIPDELVFERYEGISFVPEDFFSGAGDNWEVE